MRSTAAVQHDSPVGWQQWPGPDWRALDRFSRRVLDYWRPWLHGWILRSAGALDLHGKDVRLGRKRGHSKEAA